MCYMILLNYIIILHLARMMTMFQGTMVGMWVQSWTCSCTCFRQCLQDRSQMGVRLLHWVLHLLSTQVYEDQRCGGCKTCYLPFWYQDDLGIGINFMWIGLLSGREPTFGGCSVSQLTSWENWRFWIERTLIENWWPLEITLCIIYI
jgi:hypothetical protein